jgi:WD40 repeat protein
VLKSFFLADEEILIVASMNRKITLIDLKTNKVINTFVALKGAINDIMVHKNELIVCGNDTSIRFYHLEVNKIIIIDLI